MCNGPEGECDNVEDTGESKRCQNGEVCVFGITGKLKIMYLQSFITSINFDIAEADGKTHYTRDCHEDSGEACVEEAEENVKLIDNFTI